MSRLFLDTAPVIYMVEQVAPFWPAVQGRLATPGLIAVASELTRMECLVKPLRDGNAVLLREFEQFFTDTAAEWTPFTRALFDRAAAIRAQFKFKTPDAIQLAAAVESACDVFLTNDRRLAAFTGIVVDVL
jgi:predicted nucleic acid-binding protein